MRLSAIILAAGASRRMGRDKLSLPYAGRSVLECSLAPFLGVDGICEVLIMVQPGQQRPLPPGVRAVESPRWQEGMGASLATGMAATDPTVDGYLVGLGDLPDVPRQVVAALIQHFAESGASVIVPTFEGRRGHPVLFHGCHRQALLALQGDVGGKRLLRSLGVRVQGLRVDTDGIFRDVDRPQDLEERGNLGR